MHIPDGFLAPITYLPLYGVAAVAWSWAGRGLQRRLDERTIPLLAVLSAAAFVIMLITVPIPGGTTVHASGIPVLALLFGVRTAFLAATLVFLLQALLFGAGGITALPVNALALGLIGSAVAVGLYRLLGRVRQDVAVFAAAWAAMTVSALLVALILGLQPLLASDADGSPLFFPFGIAVTVPAVVLPHLLVGVAEGFLAVAVFRFARPFAQVEAA